jgi:hypothetical protein
MMEITVKNRIKAGITLLLAMALVTLGGCKIVYTSDEFALTVNESGGGSLVVNVGNFGTQEGESYDRKQDLKLLQQSAREESFLTKAKEQGVTIDARRLEIENFTLNGHIEASSGSIDKLVTLTGHYNLVHSDGRILIVPIVGVIAQADVSDNGKIIEYNGQVAFSFPDAPGVYSFRATYDNGRASFRHDMQRMYK